MVQGGLRTQPAGGATPELSPELPADSPSARPAGLDRLGRAIVRRRWWTLGVWLVIVVLLGVGSAGVGKPFRDVFTIPGTGAQTAADILAQRFPAENQPSAQVVLHSRHGKVSPDVITDVSARLRRLEGVASVGAAQTSPNGATVIVPVSYSGTFADIPKDGLTALEGATSTARAAGLEVEYGGQVVDLLNQQSSATDHADEIGLAFALIILLFVFGTVVAALLPVSVAVIGVVVATMVLTLLATVFTIGTVAPILGTMIGLGVGIDYSLLVVSRFRQNRDEGMDVETAVGRALATAGSASLFAGCCVAIALCGLWFARHPVRRDTRLLGGAVRRRHGDRRAHAVARAARRARAAPRSAAGTAPAAQRRPGDRLLVPVGSRGRPSRVVVSRREPRSCCSCSPRRCCTCASASPPTATTRRASPSAAPTTS